ncbi:putative peroxin 20 [Erysiphe neolycopersici]|uniref:Putative peroxin 20 n=1 Tax=Erysiphe neolycopersici TaxID=212602 RepID=A0A420HZB0_9PEZI|nr:putative peroxin 20 [Erysiphe neolycopersici]
MAADSQCGGPSNALQNLQKLTSADRTLQQDRLSSRNSPLQFQTSDKNFDGKGFRSIPGPSSSKAEAEFEAFQNNAVSPPLDHTFLPQTVIQNPSSLSELPTSSSWVSDFRKLNFTEDPIEHNEFIQGQTNAWHQALERQYMISKKNDSPPSNYNDVNVTRDMRKNLYPMVNDVDGILNHLHQNWLPPYQQPSGEILDEEDFSRAFDLAADLAKNTAQAKLQDSIGNDQSLYIDETSSNQSSPLEDNVRLTQVPIGADTIENEDMSREDNQDSLSRTASRLLGSVHNERSKKFQNSQFLELMRRFRDKEATIQGDQVVGEKLEIP